MSTLKKKIFLSYNGDNLFINNTLLPKLDDLLIAFLIEA